MRNSKYVDFPTPNQQQTSTSCRLTQVPVTTCPCHGHNTNYVRPPLMACNIGTIPQFIIDISSCRCKYLGINDPLSEIWLRAPSRVVYAKSSTHNLSTSTSAHHVQTIIQPARTATTPIGHHVMYGTIQALHTTYRGCGISREGITIAEFGANIKKPRVACQHEKEGGPSGCQSERLNSPVSLIVFKRTMIFELCNEVVHAPMGTSALASQY
ncbi:hypothetical protein F4801DRAFT_536625 [Xylaria longipes]|nr:hypothetical protein F4801DRAFT_536625 [Xylaria longipes]